MGHRTSSRCRRVPRQAVQKIEAESTLEARLLRAVARLGGKCLKLPAVHYAGIPDRLLLLPEARVRFLELKRYGKRPTEIQRWWLNELHTLGFDAQFIAGTEELNRYLLTL